MLESLFNKVAVPHPAIVLKKDFKAVVFLLILQKNFYRRPPVAAYLII